MGKKRLVYQVGLGVLLVMVIALASSVGVRAQECRVVRIGGMVIHDSISLEPEKMLISKGTCVVWFNRATAANVKIIFEDGKTCAAATDVPTGFSMDTYGACYVTSWVPFAGTSSLRFNEKGTYDYTIEMASGGPESLVEKGKKVAAGSIIVSE